MPGKFRIGDAWTGPFTWTTGQTTKFLVASNQVTRTVVAQTGFPTLVTELILSEDLRRWKRLGVWLKSTKSVNGQAQTFATRTCHLFPLFAQEYSPRIVDTASVFPIFADMGASGGIDTTLRNQPTFNTTNSPIIDSMGLNAVSQAMILLSAFNGEWAMGPVTRVGIVLDFVSSAITTTNTYDMEIRFIYGN